MDCADGSSLSYKILKKPDSVWVLRFFCFLTFLPWLFYEMHASLNSNISWLLICAERIIDGQSMSGACYDTNPPLSILLYTPFVLLHQFLHIDLPYTVFFGTLLHAAVSALATAFLLRKIKPDLISSDITLCTFAFALSVTVIPSLNFAERDHFIAIWIVPLLLQQIAISKDVKLSPFLSLPVVIFGTVSLLLKPHFMLVPALVLLHRLIFKRNILQRLKDLDFIVMGIITALYALVIYLYFFDYVSEILPNVVSLYLGYADTEKTLLTLRNMLPFIFLPLAVTLFDKDTASRQISLILCGAFFICLVCFAAQMKGFTYHKLPAMSVIFLAIAFATARLLNVLNFQKTYMILAILFLPVLSYGHSPLLSGYPTHEDYKKNPVTTYMHHHCPSPCSFYITYENMDIVSQIAFYSQDVYATRFPALWFTPKLRNNSDINSTEIQKKQKQFADMVGEDLARYKPSMILLQRTENQDSLKFFEYFSTSDIFRKEAEKYQRYDVLNVERGQNFYKGTRYAFEYVITWDVYKRVGKE